MSKFVILILLMTVSSSIQAQSSGSIKKCQICNKPIGHCEYRGKHPQKTSDVPAPIVAKPQIKPQTRPIVSRNRTPNEPPPVAVKSHAENLRIIGGLYSGELLNGKPHGKGMIKYSSEVIISKNDPEQRHAYPNECVEGHFENGEFVYGIYHSLSGDRKLFFGSKEE